MFRILLPVGAFALSLAAAPSNAQSYPVKPVRVVVPSAPGGGLDTSTRLMGKHLSARMGQSFVIENRPGAENTLGTDVVAKSPPDGYTLVSVSSGFAMDPALKKDMPYNARKDLAPVAFIGEQPLVLVVGTKVPVNNIRELQQLAKAKPGTLSFAGSDPSTIMATEMFRDGMKADIQIVPYKGAGQAVIDILGGHITGVITSFASVRQQMGAGSIRALAVTSPARSPVYPDLPTLSESIAPGYEFPSWYMLMAPAGTPLQILTQLNKEVLAVVQIPETREVLTTMALSPVLLPLDGVQQRLTRDFDKWQKLIGPK